MDLNQGIVTLKCTFMTKPFKYNIPQHKICSHCLISHLMVVALGTLWCVKCCEAQMLLHLYIIMLVFALLYTEKSQINAYCILSYVLSIIIATVTEKGHIMNCNIGRNNKVEIITIVVS
jgi:hypothetical protein